MTYRLEDGPLDELQPAMSYPTGNVTILVGIEQVLDIDAIDPGAEPCGQYVIDLTKDEIIEALSRVIREPLTIQPAKEGRHG